MKASSLLLTLLMTLTLVSNPAFSKEADKKFVKKIGKFFKNVGVGISNGVKNTGESTNLNAATAKFKRDFMKKCLKANDTRKNCRKQYKKEKEQEIRVCQEVQKLSKRSCKRKRKERILTEVYPEYSVFKNIGKAIASVPKAIDDALATKKYRNLKIKECVAGGKKKKACRKEFVENKEKEINTCVESGKSKAKCRKERRARIHQDHYPNYSIFKNIGMGIGKGATFITTSVMKPFVNSFNFMKGALEKEGTNETMEKAMLFFLDNEKDLQELYKKATSIEHYAELVGEYMDKKFESMEEKAMKAVQGMIAELGIEVEGLLEVESLQELMDLLSEEVDAEKIMEAMMAKGYGLDNLDEAQQYIADVANKNLQCQKLDKLVGTLTANDVASLLEDSEAFIETILSQNEDMLMDLEDLLDENKKALIKEGIVTVASEMIVPSIAVGAATSAVGGVATGGVLLAANGITAASALKCVKEQDSEDPQMQKFCSYVLLRTGHQILRSKAKGYTAGKEFRRNVVDRIATSKYKKQEMKACKKEGKKAKQCREEYNNDKKAEVEKCILELGLSKKECKAKRRQRIHSELFPGLK